MNITGTEIHLLAIFDAVVRNNGFSAAQADLGLSQPTISNHITALEERLGVKLCQRGRRGFLLTEKGRIVHDLSQSLLGALDEHASKLAELRGNLVGQLKIAVVDCLATDPNFRLPEAIATFRELAPSVRLEMSIERPQDIQTGVRNGTLHIGVGGFDNLLNGVEIYQLYREQHALYCGQRHPLFNTDLAQVQVADLTLYPWVHRGYWSRQRQRGRPSTVADVAVQEIEAQIMMVLSGCYLGLLPRHAVGEFLHEGRVKELPYAGHDTAIDIQMVAKSGPTPLVIERFRDLMISTHLS